MPLLILVCTMACHEIVRTRTMAVRTDNAKYCRVCFRCACGYLPLACLPLLFFLLRVLCKYRQVLQAHNRHRVNEPAGWYRPHICFLHTKQPSLLPPTQVSSCSCSCRFFLQRRCVLAPISHPTVFLNDRFEQTKRPGFSGTVCCIKAHFLACMRDS